MIVKAVGKYEIVGVIGGYMVYPEGVPVAPVPRPSQLYGRWEDAEALAKWLAQRDAGYP